MATTYIRSYAHENQATVFRNMYGWMSMALVISALSSLVSLKWLESSVAYQQFLFSTGGMIIMMVVAIVLVVILAGRLQKLSFGAATGIFIAYSILNGLWLAPIFLVFTQTSIVSTLLITAGTFGAISLYGYITEANLAKIGQICIMALFGLIIATVVNYFMQSERMQYIISYAGVLIFCGLTAYDTQKYKKIIMGYEGEITDEVKKIALLGALELYLDFINLFLYLLRILGKRR